MVTMVGIPSDKMGDRLVTFQDSALFPMSLSFTQPLLRSGCAAED